MTYYELGDHNVPKNWAQYVVKRDKGETPGPPIIWSDPQIPDDAVQMPEELSGAEWEMPWDEFAAQAAPFICIMPILLSLIASAQKFAQFNINLPAFVLSQCEK